jgi:hypothetical protein
VFIQEQVLMEADFDQARAGLAKLARDNALTSASEDAYGEGIKDLIRVGPLGSVPGTSKLVQVRFRELAQRDDRAGLAVRWEATGPGGGLFPALDADITVTPVDEQTITLRLAGSYRPPLGTLGAALDTAILHRIATATIRSFLNRLAAAIADPPASAA